MPGTLTSRITATSNAVFTLQNMFVWNVLPPCVATLVGDWVRRDGEFANGGSIDGAFRAFLFWPCFVSPPPAARCITNLPTGRRRWTAKWSTSSATCRWSGRSADSAANTGGSTTRSTGKWQRGGAACCIWRSCALLHAGVTVFLTIGLLGWAIVLWQNGAATTGDVVLVCTLGLSILHATRDLAVALVDVTQHLARLSEALATLLIPHHLRDHPKATSLVRSGATVAFENIAFCYPDGRKVFENLSLRIDSGERAGLVGQSGCGKSTLFSLLQRFYDVQGGRILVGGQDIARVTQESLRAAIAVVPQDISLFHRSIMENIRYGRPDASDDEVQEAVIAANCAEFIANLPQGAATIVGDRGVKLSPGQRQRIGIARAFLKDAPILLLDEATSALDSEFGGAGPAGARSPDGWPDRDRYRSPAVDAAQFRSHRRPARGSGMRRRCAASPCSGQGGLFQPAAARGGATGQAGGLSKTARPVLQREPGRWPHPEVHDGQFR